MSKSIFAHKKKIIISIHVVAWLLIFVIPIFFFGRSDDTQWVLYWWKNISTPISFLLIFYINYCLLIDRFLFANRMKSYITHNLAIIALLCAMNYCWQNFLTPDIQPRSVRLQEKIEQLESEIKELKRSEGAITISPQEEVSISKTDISQNIQRDRKRFRWWHIITDIFTLTCIAGIAVAIKTTARWIQTEEKRQEEEKQKVEAELKNLKSQINPHFLFNTLNNIYALIAISPEKSQEAVMDLSKMLRYVLYDDGQQYVPIQKEIDFINNYVKLMRLRLSSSVRVDVTTDVSLDPTMPIAPLLFISLIENAFKHGISNNQSSFIEFSIKETETNTVRCELRNSYFPKSAEHDKSGSGIGMENTKRRLELIYPNSHVFEYGVEGDVYHSLLIINTKKEENA